MNRLWNGLREVRELVSREFLEVRGEPKGLPKLQPTRHHIESCSTQKGDGHLSTKIYTIDAIVFRRTPFCLAVLKKAKY